MLFNSLSFLLFLPIVFTIYWWVNKKSLQLQNGLPLLVSYFFCTCSSNSDFFSKLNNRVPELYDYSNFIKEDSLFATCGHLNKKGATVFTSMLLEKHFGIHNLRKK